MSLLVDLWICEDPGNFVTSNWEPWKINQYSIQFIFLLSFHWSKPINQTYKSASHDEWHNLNINHIIHSWVNKRADFSEVKALLKFSSAVVKFGTQ